eukprot:355515-Chlamydomonas_euryale.AAC.2
MPSAEAEYERFLAFAAARAAFGQGMAVTALAAQRHPKQLAMYWIYPGKLHKQADASPNESGGYALFETRMRKRLGCMATTTEGLCAVQCIMHDVCVDACTTR